MSEVQSRPGASRGRGSGRGGRGGGFSTRASTRPSNKPAATNGDSKHDVDSSLPTLEDEGQIGELKKKYGGKIGVIKEMFAEWSDVDILYALHEADGDENLAVTRIADGNISQWGEVSKQKKERARPKAKNDTFTTTTADSVAAPGATRTARGGRNATEGARGRPRAGERGGRGGSRGKPANAAAEGTRPKEEQPLSVPTEESSAWDTTKSADHTPSWGDSTSIPAASETAPAAASTGLPKPSIIPEGTPRTWANMVRQSTVPKPGPKPKEPPVSKPTETVIEPLPPVEPTPAETKPATTEQAAVPATHEQPSSEPPVTAKPEVVTLPPSKDQLTQTNLEHVADESHPPVTETVRSEAADSWNPHPSAASSVTTPLSNNQQQQQALRGASSGFALSAVKATDRTAGRIPTYPRRLLDQEEAVRMPGNRDQVDRATVQFGAFSLNGPVEEDIDGDREEPETRTQPPDDSPVAHPRTSFPPAQPAPVPEAFPSQKPAVTLPPPPGPTAAPAGPPSQPSAVSQAAQPSTQNAQPFGQYGQTLPQDPSFLPSQKPFDTFGQQPGRNAVSQSQFEGGFPSQPQPQSQQQPGGVPGGAFSSGPGDYSSYYTADQQNRTPYSYYNQQFGQQQAAQGQQEGVSSQQQRPFGGYNGPQGDNLNQYPQSGAHHTQGRYGAASSADTQTSGNTTPNPSATQTQQQGGQSAQAQSHGQQQQQPQDYYAAHPYFTSPYYAAYVNHYQTGYNQGGYGGPYGKGGLYGQPHQYGMSPQGPYGHASSPAGGFGQNSLHRGESSGSGGLGDYGRAGSAQSGNQPGLGGTGFGSMHDTFARGASGYQSQAGAQGFSGPASQQGNPPTVGDDLKPFSDSKAGAGPSPSLAAAARPGSATNSQPAQSGLPPPQSNQQAGLGMSGYGGYPSHLQGHGLHGNQSGAGGYGMSASGGQAHSNTPYGGGYGAQGFGGSYYGNQPRGWGNNYH